jgi:hypothetical protein
LREEEPIWPINTLKKILSIIPVATENSSSTLPTRETSKVPIGIKHQVEGNNQAKEAGN